MHAEKSTISYSSGYRPVSPTMKKYYQLALVIISFVSVVTLLFYRHEYNRLRYVLEVLNFFGKPGVQPNSFSADDCIIPNASLEEKSVNFAEPSPAWQRLSSAHFVYSAFWEVTDEEKRVKALSFDFESSNLNLGCSLWFEDRDTPVKGQFNFYKIDDKQTIRNKNKGASYYLLCRAKNTINVPYGVSFYKTDEIVPSSAFISVYNSVGKLALSNSTAICITAAATPGLLKSSIAEFLSYHMLVGVTNYIIYDGGLPTSILSTLRSSAIRDGLGLHVTVLPWNFPFPHYQADAVAKDMIEKDCLLRTAGKVHNTAILTWDEYIVPKYHHNLASMLDDFDSGRKTTARFEIPMMRFCTEFPDDNNALPAAPLVLRKTRYSISANASPFYFYRPHLISAGYRDLAFTTQRVSQGIAAVHRYASCIRNDGKLAETSRLSELSMLRFSEDLKRSKLLKMWTSGRLFI